MRTQLLASRLARRLAVCVGLLVLLDLFVRGHAVAIESVFLRHYRMPDVLVPPLDAYSAAIRRQRERQPGYLYAGFAGPSFIYGSGVAETEALPAQIQERLDKARSKILSLNLALPGNRYDDDRLIARSFAGALDVVFVPYSAGIAAWMVDSCPQHLELLEWSDQDVSEFVLPPSCSAPPAHAVNTWLDRGVTSIWAAYAHRAALRKWLFPTHGDLGRLAFDVVHKRLAKRHGHPAPVNGRPPQLLRVGTTGAREVPAEISAQVNRLCDEYTARGTRVLFYLFPQFERPEQPREELELFDALDAAIRSRAAADPRCGVLALDAAPTAEEYRDFGHPNARGFATLADALSKAIIELGRSSGLGRALP